MRVRSLRIFHLILILLLLAASSWAEDAQGDAADQEDAAQEDAAAQEEEAAAQEEDGADENNAAEGNYAAEEDAAAQADDAVTEAQQADEQGYWASKFEVCADAVIEVSDISILCDSPGTYYYGSNKYRNSASCKAGDKAKLVVDFYIDDPTSIQKAGGYIFTTIKVDGYGAIADHTVYENVDLCSLSKLKAKSGASCPSQGKYQIATQFFFGDKNNNIDYSFVPKVHVGFKSSLQKDGYDLGGANVDWCSGNTFISWSDSVRKQYANAINNFMRTFGLLTFTLSVIWLFIYWLWRRPKTFSGEEPESEDMDFKKMRLVGTSRDIIDF